MIKMTGIAILMMTMVILLQKHLMLPITRDQTKDSSEFQKILLRPEAPGMSAP